MEVSLDVQYLKCRGNSQSELHWTAGTGSIPDEGLFFAMFSFPARLQYGSLHKRRALILRHRTVVAVVTVFAELTDNSEDSFRITLELTASLDLLDTGA